jgi:hypothetical protein
MQRIKGSTRRCCCPASAATLACPAVTQQICRTKNAGRGMITRIARGERAVTESSILNCRPFIEGLEQDLGISIETIAVALAVDRRTVERWRANQSVPQARTAK